MLKAQFELASSYRGSIDYLCTPRVKFPGQLRPSQAYHPAMLGRMWETLLGRSGSVASQMAELRGWLRAFEGGAVVLDRNHVTGIATIRLDQPDKKNAITGLMMTQLEEAVECLETWSGGKGVLVYGTGHNFCSGGDLDFAKKIATPAEGHKMAVFMQAVVTRLQMLPLVSVALIEGAGALGGGAEIAMACDWRLMTHDTRGLSFVHQRMGIAPAWGGAARLVHAVGYSTALDMMCTGRLVRGPEAIRLGLAQDVIQCDDPVMEAMAWLQHRTQAAPQVVQALKTMASSAREKGLSEAMEGERDAMSPLWGGPANLEAHSKNIKHRL